MLDMSDNRGTLCDAGNSWLPVDVDNKEIRCVTIPEVRMHVHVSDNRETMSNGETSCSSDDAVFHVDVSDNKERLCDEKSYSCVHVRMSD